MPKRKKQGLEADEAHAAPLGSATKRRRALNAPGRDDTTQEHVPERSGGRRRSPAVAAAAPPEAASASDDGSASEGEDGRTELERASAGFSEDGTAMKHWHGVRRTKSKGRTTAGFRVRVKLLNRSVMEVGTFRSGSLAAQVHDRALIAMHGRKAAAAQGLNFPLEAYPKQEERQRYGPDLNAYLLQLREAREAEEEDAEGEAVGRGCTTGLQRQQPQALALANLRRAADGLPVKEATALVSRHRAADPLWCPPQKTCGVCPACRQPWRTDLGGCVRLAAGRAAGHREPAVVKLLASDPQYTQALKVQSERQVAAGEPAAQQPAAEQRQAGQPARRKGAKAKGAGGEASESESEVEWLEQPVGATAGEARLQKLLKGAHAALKQALGGQELRVAAVLQEEQRLGAPQPAAAAPPRRRGRSGRGGAAASGAAAGVQGAGRVQGQGDVDPQLLDPFTWLARAQPPRNHLSSRGQEPADLLRLAALCRAGGAEAPLSVEAAGQLLEEEEQQREEELLLLRQHRRRRRHGGDGGEDGGGDAAAGSPDREGGGWQAEAEGRDGALCVLCGAAQHSRQGFKGCPVVKMALAVPKPPPVCPGCAQQEIPGCALCQGGQERQRSRRALAQPFVRRAPWVEALPPATRGLMLAAQDVASAAVADLGVPQAAWRCTPKALLAVGLLAEEAARRELAARWPGDSGDDDGTGVGRR